jgi:hypothetical protein
MDPDPDLDPDPGPALFGSEDANKKYFFLSFLFIHTFPSVFKDKKSLKRQKTVEITGKVFLYFLLVERRIRVRMRTNNYGSACLPPLPKEEGGGGRENGRNHHWGKGRWGLSA